MTRNSDYSRDPLDILIRRESVTCKGCVYERTEKVFARDLKTCSKGRKLGKKCLNYKERD